jgi:hypothetical protein
MTLALARAVAEGSGFNKDFYAASATLIPVFFIALAVEGRFIRVLLSASQKATDTLGQFIFFYAIYVFLKAIGVIKPEAAPAKPPSPPRRPPGRLRRVWRRIATGLKDRGFQAALFTALAVALVPAFLAICIVVLGTAAEIAAVVALYDMHANSWTGPFVLGVLIFLIIEIAFPPAAVLTRAGYKAFRETREQLGATSSETETTKHAPAPAAATDTQSTGASQAAEPLPEPPSPTTTADG